MITVRSLVPFEDAITGEHYEAGRLLKFDDKERVKFMCQRSICELVHIDPPKKKAGKRVLVYQNLLFKIGGIETADYQMARAFPNKNIVFAFRHADIEQALRLAQYAEVQMDDGEMKFECDVLILANYDSYQYIKGRVKAGKIYQQVHADWANMKRMPQWANFEWQPDEDVDKVLAVSETSVTALQTAFKQPIHAELVPNILNQPEDNGFRVFLSLSRFTAEKGADMVVAMVRKFEEANKHFLWIICGTMSDSRLNQKLALDKHVVFVEPTIYNEGLIKNCDYLVQLSKNESYCYSVHQALASGKPCICTDIPEFRKVIKPGENGWLVDQSLQNLDIDKIFGKLLKPKPTVEPVPSIWEKVLEGEL